jgi:hypothetical protein
MSRTQTHPCAAGAEPHLAWSGTIAARVASRQQRLGIRHRFIAAAAAAALLLAPTRHAPSFLLHRHRLLLLGLLVAVGGR